jgi:hypothetical protein
MTHGTTLRSRPGDTELLGSLSRRTVQRKGGGATQNSIRSDQAMVSPKDGVAATASPVTVSPSGALR